MFPICSLYVPIYSLYFPYIFPIFSYIFPIFSYIFQYVPYIFPIFSHVLHTFHHEIFWALQPRQPARAWYITTLPSLQPMTTLFCLRQKWLGHAWPQWHGKLC